MTKISTIKRKSWPIGWADGWIYILMILRSPDGDKKKKTVHTLANIGDVGVAALLWRRLPVPRLSGQYHKLQWLHKVNAACKT